MHHPGLVTPSNEERVMQIAHTAKHSSGCISRQVGAAITDENFSIKSIGWNDVPEGYETMGHILATPHLFGTLEKAQSVIEKKAGEKGADAVVFEGIGQSVTNPTYTTTEHIARNDDGSSTRTSTTKRDDTVSYRLKATFIKYKKSAR